MNTNKRVYLFLLALMLMTFGCDYSAESDQASLDSRFALSEQPDAGSAVSVSGNIIGDVITTNTPSAEDELGTTHTYRIISSGSIHLYRNDVLIHSANGGGGGGRGVNVFLIDPDTGELISPVKNFDLYSSRRTGQNHFAFLSYLDSIPDGTLVLIAACDDMGLTNWPPSDCVRLGGSHIQATFQTLEELGARKLSNYCYRDHWTFVTLAGSGVALQEDLQTGITEAESQFSFTTGVPITVPDAERDPINPFGNGDVLLQASSSGKAVFFKNGVPFYSMHGGGGGGRGFNLAVMDAKTGILLGYVHNWDTYGTRRSGGNHRAMKSYIESLPDGVLLLFAIADEAGLTNWNSARCIDLNGSHIEETYSLLEELGSTKIRDYCYRDLWSMITIKGSGEAIDESLATSGEAVTNHTISPTITYQEYDLIDNLKVHNFFNGSEIVTHQVTNGELSCGEICGWVNDHHAHEIEFVAPVDYVASGMAFYGRLDKGQIEHLVIQLNDDEEVVWTEQAAEDYTGEDRWFLFTVPVPFNVHQGENTLKLSTRSFPSTNSDDGSIHFEQKDGERGYFALYQSSGDADGDLIADNDEDVNGDSIIDPLGPDGEPFTYDDETNPFLADTDGDGVDDYTELLQGYDPNDPKSTPALGPQVISINPPDGATDVDPFAEIVIEFSEPVMFDAAFLASNLVSLGGYKNVSGTIQTSSDRKALTFKPDSLLFPGVQVEVKIEKSVWNDEGYFANKFKSAFHTRADVFVEGHDSDLDGYDDYTEYIYYSDPKDPESQPNDEASGEMGSIELAFVVGDDSGSDSEWYEMYIKKDGQQFRRLTPLGPGELAQETIRLDRGYEYTITVKHFDSKFEEPDYDYTATIGGDGVDNDTAFGPGYIIDDSADLLGVHYESSYDHAMGKEAKLYVVALGVDSSSTELIRGEEKQVPISVFPNVPVVKDNVQLMVTEQTPSVDYILAVLDDNSNNLTIGNYIDQTDPASYTREVVFKLTAYIDDELKYWIPIYSDDGIELDLGFYTVELKKDLTSVVFLGWEALKQEADQYLFNEVQKLITNEMKKIWYADGEGAPHYFYDSVIDRCASSGALAVDNWFYDELFGQYLKSSIEKLEQQKINEDFSIEFSEPEINAVFEGIKINVIDPDISFYEWIDIFNAAGHFDEFFDFKAVELKEVISSDGDVGEYHLNVTLELGASCAHETGNLDYYVTLMVTLE